VRISNALHVPLRSALAAALALSGAACSEPAPQPRPEPRPVETAFHAESAFAGVLALAKEDRPGLDVAAARARIDGLSVALGAELRTAKGAVETGEAISRVFFGTEDFGADPQDPLGRKLDSYDLGRVLERRKGACLPIAIAIARAAQGAGVLAGVVRAPGHAYVAIGPPSDRVYVDPAERGRVRSWSEISLLEPWAPEAGFLYDGRPLRSDEVVALHRASRAAIRLEAGKLSEAEADARAALAATKDLPEALVNLAAVLLKRKGEGDLDEAGSLLERARALLPRSAAVLYNSGLLEAAKGDDAAALRYFDAALQIAPSYEEARANKAALESRGRRK